MSMGLRVLTDAEFERAKEKILGEEPNHAYACMPVCVPNRSLASEDMARGGGGQSARVFCIGVILDLILVIVFWSSLHTVLRKALKGGCKMCSKGSGPGGPCGPGCFYWKSF